MALSLPTVEEFYAFWGDEADDVDEDRAGILLQLSANLLWLATGLEDDPDDPRLLMLVHYAISDMAIYLYITRDDVDAAYSPFQSERVGSYSYTKTYTALSKTLATSGHSATGVTFFDRVVQYLLDQALFSGGMTSSENVFHYGYQPLYMAAGGFTRWFKDPSIGLTTRSAWYTFFGNADDDEGSYHF